MPAALPFSPVRQPDAFAAPAVEAVLVSYGTADLTFAAAHALRSTHPDVPLTVVDNGSPDDTVDRLTRASDDLAPFRLAALAENLHHGPGMDAAAHASSARRLLLLDTDCLVFRPGLIDRLAEAMDGAGAWAAGPLHHVDANGFDTDADGAIPYVHPHCALIDRATYLTLEPFARHGAPSLFAMRSAHQRGLAVADVPTAEYAYHIGRGTVVQHGYALGWKSRLAQVKRRVLRQ
jgi:glycosyltransferase involved in cell wall biosynthesis